jgi:4-oxalocrotonate tautomerase
LIEKESTLPHVIVKMWSGRSDQQKRRLADEVTAAVLRAVGGSESSISVAIEDVDPNDWTEKVYKPDILGRPDQIYKKPGY